MHSVTHSLGKKNTSFQMLHLKIFYIIVNTLLTKLIDCFIHILPCVQQDMLTINRPKYLPGEEMTLTLSGPPQTHFALMAVDQAVYLLRNRSRLTSDKVSFCKMSKLFNVKI